MKQPDIFTRIAKLHYENTCSGVKWENLSHFDQQPHRIATQGMVAKMYELFEDRITAAKDIAERCLALAEENGAVGCEAAKELRRRLKDLEIAEVHR